MKNIIKNKKGSISIVGIIITIIIVTALSGYMSIMNSSWVYNEIQSVMDLCATNALQQSIDSQALRKEILGVSDPTTGNSGTDTSIGNNGQWQNNVNLKKVNNILEGLYRAELDKNISTNDMITNINLVSFDADLVYESWGATYNGTAKKRPQIRLDAVTQITLKTNSEFDGLNNYNVKFFNAKNGKDFSIKVSGVTGDGRVVLTVRTLSRVLYK